jgi:hypothetical protein
VLSRDVAHTSGAVVSRRSFTFTEIAERRELRSIDTQFAPTARRADRL